MEELAVRRQRRGRTAAILFSPTATRRGLGIDPFAYLREALGRMTTHMARRITELLPDRRRALQTC